MNYSNDPINGKAPGACNIEGLADDTTKDSNSVIASRHRKAESTICALLALAGRAVHPLMDGRYLVCKYGCNYEAKDLGNLRAFAVRLGLNV